MLKPQQDRRPRRSCRFLPPPTLLVYDRKPVNNPRSFTACRAGCKQVDPIQTRPTTSGTATRIGGRARTYGHFVGEGPRNSCERRLLYSYGSQGAAFPLRAAWIWSKKRRVQQQEKERDKDAANKRGGRRDETAGKRKRKREREDEEGGVKQNAGEEEREGRGRV